MLARTLRGPYAEITTPVVTSNQNDYNPTGWDTAGVVRIATDGARSISGFAAPTALGVPRKRIIYLEGEGTSLTILNDSASSSSANRVFLQLAGNADFTMSNGQGIDIVYDATLAHWVLAEFAGYFTSDLDGRMPLVTVKQITGEGGSQVQIASPLRGKDSGGSGNTLALKKRSIVFASDANKTLAVVDYTFPFLIVTSSVSLTATRDLILPLQDGSLFVVINSTTGAQSIRAIGASGSGVTIPNGQRAIVISDGTDFVAL